MNSTTKPFKIVKFLSTVFCVIILQSCIISNPTKEHSVKKQIQVTDIYEGGVKDIVFAEANKDFYYINRGLEQGYTIKDLKEKVLNKTVTLHLSNTIWGNSTPHIAQLMLNDGIIYSEFK